MPDSQFQTVRLIVDSQKCTIDGSEYGADVINMSLTAKTGVASDSYYLDRAVN